MNIHRNTVRVSISNENTTVNICNVSSNIYYMFLHVKYCDII